MCAVAETRGERMWSCSQRIPRGTHHLQGLMLPPGQMESETWKGTRGAWGAGLLPPGTEKKDRRRGTKSEID